MTSSCIVEERVLLRDLYRAQRKNCSLRTIQGQSVDLKLPVPAASGRINAKQIDGNGS